MIEYTLHSTQATTYPVLAGVPDAGRERVLLLQRRPGHDRATLREKLNVVSVRGIVCTMFL